MRGRKPNLELTERYQEQILDMRKKGLGTAAIRKRVPVSESLIDGIIYPHLRTKRNAYMLGRYYKAKSEGRCHQCGQKIPKKQ